VVVALLVVVATAVLIEDDGVAVGGSTGAASPTMILELHVPQVGTCHDPQCQVCLKFGHTANKCWHHFEEDYIPE
jgi:hypothetical protein